MTTATFSQTCLKALRAFALTLIPALLLAGCGDGPRAALPFAPSDIPASATALETADDPAAIEATEAFDALGSGKGKGGSDKGQGGGNDKGKDSDEDKKKDRDTATHTGAVVKIKGAIASVTGACPAVTFVVGTRSVKTAAGTTSYDDGACEQLVKDAVVEVRAMRQTDGTLLARKVEFEQADEQDEQEGHEDDDHSGPNPHDGLGPYDGTVSRFHGPCPIVTFNLKGMTIVTTGATVYVHHGVPGDYCAMLRPNVKVSVTRGAGSVGRVVMAGTITITRAPTSGPGPEDDEHAEGGEHGPRVEFRGYLQALGPQACPGVTFTIGTQAVIANEHTDFKHGPCAHLENGTWVEVNGIRQADGTVLASKIQMKEVQFTGVISLADGVCPTKTLVVDTATVKTYATTSFEKLLCQGFVKDLRVAIKGTEHSLGLVKAVRVKYEGF